MAGWRPCCEDSPCGCDNEHCENGYAPCCFAIRFTGFTDNGCNDCDEFNDKEIDEQVFHVQQQSIDEDVWECRNLEFCSYDRISLTLSKDGDDYLLTVELDDHKWEKNFGETKPVCCDIAGEDIPHVTNSGNCDTSGSTCNVTRLSGAETPCPCTYQQCSLCLDSVAPNAFAIDFNGVAGVPCCGTLHNETFITDLITGGTATCRWLYTFPGGDALAVDHENFVQFYCGGPGEFGSPEPSRYWWFTRYLRVRMIRESFANNNVILEAALTIERQPRFGEPCGCFGCPNAHDIWLYTKTFPAGLDCQTLDETINFNRRIIDAHPCGLHPCDPSQSAIRIQAV